ncbi:MULTISPECIES: hypothetical protein [unclassified Bradyrhizobium]|uniref:hypothetical protein n=1 Tax=unclassified Bradyrhizobium TaxID=2631580 RepID=UPI0028F174BB|nr:MULTISPECIES: hypothetical protein [unclassified Bradyrhizobium]
MGDALDDESMIKGAVRPFGVSVDYDDTFTSCKETWTAVIAVLRMAGARVVCVTSRRPEMVVSDFPGEVFYCSGRPKREVMHEHGVDIHVWIDDQPEYIGQDPNRLLLKSLAGIV